MIGDPNLVARAAAAAIQEVDPEQPVSRVRTLDTYIDEELSGPRQHQAISTVFAALAVLLAALGIFAVLSFGVSLRTREIGVRAALGAAPGSIARMVTGSGLRLAAIGVVLGLIAAVSSIQLLRAKIDRVPEPSLWLAAAVAAFFLSVAAVAAWLPAARAARIDPASVLRDE